VEPPADERNDAAGLEISCPATARMHSDQRQPGWIVKRAALTPPPRSTISTRVLSGVRVSSGLPDHCALDRAGSDLSQAGPSADGAARVCQHVQGVTACRSTRRSSQGRQKRSPCTGRVTAVPAAPKKAAGTTTKKPDQGRTSNTRLNGVSAARGRVRSLHRSAASPSPHPTPGCRARTRPPGPGRPGCRYRPTRRRSIG
jgi:hypothetical protein